MPRGTAISCPESTCSTRQSRTLRIVFPVPAPPVTPTSTRGCFARARFWIANASGSKSDSICSRVTSIRTTSPAASSSGALPSSCMMRLTSRDAARRASFPRKSASHRNTGEGLSACVFERQVISLAVRVRESKSHRYDFQHTEITASTFLSRYHQVTCSLAGLVVPLTCLFEPFDVLGCQLRPRRPST